MITNGTCSTAGRLGFWKVRRSVSGLRALCQYSPQYCRTGFCGCSWPTSLGSHHCISGSFVTNTPEWCLALSMLVSIAIFSRHLLMTTHFYLLKSSSPLSFTPLRQITFWNHSINPLFESSFSWVLVNTFLTHSGTHNSGLLWTSWPLPFITPGWRTSLTVSLSTRERMWLTCFIIKWVLWRCQPHNGLIHCLSSTPNG